MSLGLALKQFKHFFITCLHTLRPEIIQYFCLIEYNNACAPQCRRRLCSVSKMYCVNGFLGKIMGYLISSNWLACFNLPPTQIRSFLIMGFKHRSRLFEETFHILNF